MMPTIHPHLSQDQSTFSINQTAGTPNAPLKRNRSGTFKDEITPSKSTRRDMSPGHADNMEVETDNSTADCVHESFAADLRETDWLQIKQLNMSVFQLLNSSALAFNPDPLVLINQRLHHKYPGVELIEYFSDRPPVISVRCGKIAIRHDFLQRITAPSQEAEALVARAVLTDCIVCMLNSMHQSKSLFIREIDTLHHNAGQQFDASRQAALQIYERANELPMPDQFSTLCVLDHIPL